MVAIPLPGLTRIALFAVILIAQLAGVQAQSYYAYGGPIPNNTTGTTFTQNVTGVGSLTGTNRLRRVCLSITQPVPADIDIYLISPAGTTVMLSTDNGGSSGNDYHTGLCFSECGPSGSIIGANDFKGVYLPEQSLAAFNNGQNGNGTWTLRIDDDAATGGAGTLNYWEIEFGTTTMPTTPNGRVCSTAYTLSTLPYSHTCMTLASAGNDYTNGSCNSHIDGAEYLFSYTPSTPEEFLSIDIAQDFSTPSGFPTVSLLDTCPNVALAADCIQTEIQFNSTENILHITSVPLVQGKQYYIVVASTSGTGGVYDIRIGMGRNGNDDCLQATNLGNGIELAGNNIGATIPNLQAPSTLEMTCNGFIDNFVFYTFTTDAVGGTVHANLTDIDCDLSCGGSCGVQVALFQAPAGGACLGGGTWGAPIACEASTLANSYYTWNGLLPNTQYYLMVDGNAGSPCVWNLRVLGGITGTALPVTLAEFEATHQEGGNLLTWIATQEAGADHYTIEHSTTLPDFEDLSDIPVQGTEAPSYRFIHPDATPGWHYYRLRMVDIDGQFSHSAIAKVRVEPAPGEFLVYPSLVHESLNIQHRSATEWTATFRSMDGRERLRSEFAEAASPETVSINTSALAAGLYIVEVRQGPRLVHQQKVVKQ